MFTQEQVDKLKQIEEQVRYYRTAKGLNGLPMPTSQQSVYIDRVVSMLGFDKDPKVGARMVDVIMSMLSTPRDATRPRTPRGWAVLSDATEKSVAAVFEQNIQAVVGPALDAAKHELAKLVFDKSTKGNIAARVIRFVRTCDATLEYVDDDNKKLIVDVLKRHDLRRDWSTVYTMDFNTCHYVRRVHADGGQVRLAPVAGVEPIAFVRGRYYLLRRRDKHFRYWKECRCLARLAELTGAPASQWRAAVRAIGTPLISDIDLFAI
ncbi:hypothetical protein IJGMMPBP_00018 [Infectious spleen and kidney necrosis virus]|uniref:ORF015R n=3 Tax=Infectious spleen and kidney necrosis virus TaxID=180170 RepID=Q8QUU5_ISKNN|nr:ORF015R [Infectious spleen and kidney necrosis virus]QIQ54460.1 ORF016 [Angelfish iridovirus AFIV-16]QOE77155.1 hypothetical protein [Banggai cardinalfish iridovirus]AAL98739.1 ORF015R [Infectious spleen and kidney necrosis virus]AMM04424.1 ORF017R [Infectious spleen and kidney necrosis virus]QPO16264.1 hypothetical protein [Infectious spleen and kidney necrosis virus]